MAADNGFSCESFSPLCHWHLSAVAVGAGAQVQKTPCSKGFSRDWALIGVVGHVGSKTAPARART